MSTYSKTCVKRPLSKRPKIGFQDQLLLDGGQKYCRMLQGEHSALLLTFIKLPFVIKIFVLYIFEWLFYTGFIIKLQQEPVSSIRCKLACTYSDDSNQAGLGIPCSLISLSFLPEETL